MAKREPRTRSLHILLVPLGSAGDIHPFVAVGAALRQRGHLVTVITSPVFERLVRHIGLEFVPVGTAEEFDALLQDPHLWEFRRGFEVVAKAVLTATPQIYQIISERYVAGETIVVAAGLAFGARIAQERLGVPLATIQLQPAAFQSVYQSPVLHPWLSRIDLLPRPLKRGVFRFAYFLADRIVGPETNRFRAALGLPPARRFLSDWWNSPRRVIGLFPEWFGPPQPDWPSQTRLTGFPLYDETGVEPVSSDLARFLSDAEDQGDQPIVFTPGSAMRHGRRFFEASIEACQHLGRRGLLLTRYPDQLPTSLPRQVRHFDYVPFSQLPPSLRRAGASRRCRYARAGPRRGRSATRDADGPRPGRQRDQTPASRGWACPQTHLLSRARRRPRTGAPPELTRGRRLLRGSGGEGAGARGRRRCLRSDRAAS